MCEAELPRTDFELRLRLAAEEEALQASALRVLMLLTRAHVLKFCQARIREDVLRERLSDSELLIANMKHSCAYHAHSHPRACLLTFFIRKILQVVAHGAGCHGRAAARRGPRRPQQAVTHPALPNLVHASASCASPPCKS